MRWSVTWFGTSYHLSGTLWELSINRAEALSVINAKDPHLIILDCSMPALGGVDVLRRMKTSDSASIIPVLMLTRG